jgi:1,4-alpha-glucan branching enzyme
VPRLSRGRLALVLHSHMPYVEGFGTWPFGEEWLFEAMATSYLPLAGILGAQGEPAPITLSLTPVLADQLAAPGLGARFDAFLRELRPASHALDVDAAEDPRVAAELRRAAGDYAQAAERHDALGPAGLLGALLVHAAWTSSATHAVLPLAATDAGVRLQLAAGIDAHRARSPRGWAGGFWLPECAHAPWLDPLLEEAGVHATCVDLTDVLGRGSPEHLRPLASTAGPLLVPIDRAIVELVWSAGGYPSHAAYRDYHRRSARDHHPWAVDGTVYDPERALAQARADAADFVARARERLAGGGLCVCALDTELLGHWWYEGPAWLAAVLDEARRQGLELVHLDDALAGAAPAPPRELPTTTWGTPRDLSTWDGPAVADLAWQARDAELRVVAAGARAGLRAVRELLALQSSDWAFLAARGLAGPYPRERAAGHAAALRAALAGDPGADPELRNLAPHASLAPLLAP